VWTLYSQRLCRGVGSKWLSNLTATQWCNLTQKRQRNNTLNNTNNNTKNKEEEKRTKK